MIPRPMLAATEEFDLSILRYPILASAKIDGVRALVANGLVFSRSKKLIPNLHVQKLFGVGALEGCDGELVVGSPHAPRAMQETVSGVMSKNGTPDVSFFVFDVFNKEERYALRLSYVHELISRLSFEIPVFPIGHQVCFSPADVLRLEEKLLAIGYEGLILRTEHGSYKNGRSTLREFSSPKGGMLKLKRFSTTEAIVEDLLPAMSNLNKLSLDGFGHAKRSSAKANLEEKDILGAFICSSPEWKMPFNVSPGLLSHEERREVWANKEKAIGKVLTFKHFTQTGTKDKPRFPRFISWRPAGT